MFPQVALLVHLILAKPQPQVKASSSVVLASHTISMEDRYNNKFVNDVFKDNILLTLNYMDGTVKSKGDIDWDKIEAGPLHAEFTLKPGQEFAFHDAELPDYSKNVVQTMNSHFVSDEGFKFDGDITGDGVCHLASLIYWVAKDAGLSAYAPSNHNFAKINDIAPVYGVAIESPMPDGNLYITDSFNKPVTFVFDYDGTNLTVSIAESN